MFWSDLFWSKRYSHAFFQRNWSHGDASKMINSSCALGEYSLAPVNDHHLVGSLLTRMRPISNAPWSLLGHPFNQPREESSLCMLQGLPWSLLGGSPPYNYVHLPSIAGPSIYFFIIPSCQLPLQNLGGRAPNKQFSLRHFACLENGVQIRYSFEFLFLIL